MFMLMAEYQQGLITIITIIIFKNLTHYHYLQAALLKVKSIRRAEMYLCYQLVLGEFSHPRLPPRPHPPLLHLSGYQGSCAGGGSAAPLIFEIGSALNGANCLRVT